MPKFLNRLSIEEHSGVNIIVVDYKGLKEDEMIELVKRHCELTLEYKLPFLADFNNTYVTPGYVAHGKKFVESTRDVIDKGAFLGVDKVKTFILKGILYFYKVNYKSFSTREEAIQFLTEPIIQADNL